MAKPLGRAELVFARQVPAGCARRCHTVSRCGSFQPKRSQTRGYVSASNLSAPHRGTQRSLALICSSGLGDKSGVAGGIEGEATFAPISDEDEAFGPEKLLLVGFLPEEVTEVQELLDELEADFISPVVCTQEMVESATLMEAICTEQNDPQKVKTALGVPRVLFLSGKPQLSCATHL
eukprot:scaffold2752_cov393-Prasinococcus_capsulatus_cf.AAC.29